MKLILSLLFVTSVQAQVTLEDLAKKEIKKPRITMVTNSHGCFKMKEYNRVFNLGKYRTYEKVRCK